MQIAAASNVNRRQGENSNQNAGARVHYRRLRTVSNNDNGPSPLRRPSTRHVP